jgi:iron complex transport system ATP-binding protein
VISFDRVSVRYPGGRVRAVDEVSLVAGPSTITAISGPNGSGKSTLVRSLLGRVTLESGRVLLGDEDLARLSRRDVARRVAVVTQREEPAFPTRVRDFVALGRFSHGSSISGYSPGDHAAVDRALRRAGVVQFEDRSTEQLSGGEWQRVRVARALAQESPSLVLDEPTTFLDIAHEMSVFELLASLAGEGKCILVVSHQLNLVSRFAGQLVLLSGGRVAAQGAPDDVLRADILQNIYEWPVAVSRDPVSRSHSIIPLRSKVQHIHEQA